jgi:hypothetical protein
LFCRKDNPITPEGGKRTLKLVPPQGVKERIK